MKSVVAIERQKKAAQELSKFFAGAEPVFDNQDGLIFRALSGLGTLADKEALFTGTREDFEKQFGKEQGKKRKVGHLADALAGLKSLIEDVSPGASDALKVRFVNMPYNGENLLQSADKAFWFSNDVLKDMVDAGVTFGSPQVTEKMKHLFAKPLKPKERLAEFSKVVVQDQIDRRLIPEPWQDALCVRVDVAYLDGQHLDKPSFRSDRSVCPLNDALWALLDKKKYTDKSKRGDLVYPEENGVRKGVYLETDENVYLGIRKPMIDDLTAQGIDFSAKKESLQKIGLPLPAAARFKRLPPSSGEAARS